MVKIILSAFLFSIYGSNESNFLWFMNQDFFPTKSDFQRKTKIRWSAVRQTILTINWKKFPFNLHSKNLRTNSTHSAVSVDFTGLRMIDKQLCVLN
jgi:hypothetical protein